MKPLFYIAFVLVALPKLTIAQATNVIIPANASAPSQYNILIGPNSGNDSFTGNFNLFIGSSTGAANTTGNNNTFIGSLSGNKNTSGATNVFVGSATGAQNTTGSRNVFHGVNAGASNDTGSDNIYIGTNAGYDNMAGGQNTFLGTQAGRYSTASANTFIGGSSGYNNRTGTQNTFVGYQASLNSFTSYNTFVGFQAGIANTTGQLNTCLGYQAGRYLTTGSSNIIIGSYSGTYVTDGNDNVLMGYNTQAENGLHNAIAIGSGSRVAISNALILGHQANVGIGTSSPTVRLELVSDKLDDSGLRLTNLTTNSPATHSTDQFLTVNQKGEVIKARYQLHINDVNQWSDKVFSSSYTLRPLASVATYIGEHRHLPGIPSAEEIVKEGIDLVKLNAVLLEKVEELTLYSIQQDKLLQQQRQEINELKQQQAKVDKLEQLVKQLMEKK